MDQLLDVSLETQTMILTQLGCFPKTSNSNPDFNTPDSLFSRVNPRSRTLLKRSSHLEFIRNFETRLFRALMNRLEPWKPNDTVLLLDLDAFHRLLAHGICQFHGIKSCSQDQQSGDRLFAALFAEGAQTPQRIDDLEDSFGVFLLSDFLDRHSDSA